VWKWRVRREGAVKAQRVRRRGVVCAERVRCRLAPIHVRISGRGEDDLGWSGVTRLGGEAMRGAVWAYDAFRARRVQPVQLWL
jgi:hypothetical protein